MTSNLERWSSMPIIMHQFHSAVAPISKTEMSNLEKIFQLRLQMNIGSDTTVDVAFQVNS